MEHDRRLTRSRIHGSLIVGLIVVAGCTDDASPCASGQRADEGQCTSPDESSDASRDTSRSGSDTSLKVDTSTDGHTQKESDGSFEVSDGAFVSIGNVKKIAQGALKCVEVEVLNRRGEQIERPLELERFSLETPDMLESRMHEFCSHQERDSLEGLPDGRQYLGLIAREVGSGVLQVAYEQRNGRVVTGTTEAEVVEESVRLEKLRGEAVRVNVESAYGSYTRDVPDVVDRTGLYIPPSRLEFEIRDTSIATMSKTDRKGWVVRAKSLGTTEVIGTYDPIGSAPQSLGPAPLEVVDEELELTGLELEYQDQSPLLSGKRYIRPGSCFDVSIYGQYRSENLADSRPIGDEATFDVKTSETIRVKSEFPDGRYCVESRGGGAFRVTARGISTRLFRFVVGGRDVIDSVRVEYEGSGPVPVRRREEAPDVACPNLSFTVQYRDETTQDVTIHPASRYKVAFTASRDLQFLLPEYISVGRSANPTDEHPCLRVAGTLSETTIEVPIEAWFGGKRAKTNFPLTR